VFGSAPTHAHGVLVNTPPLKAESSVRIPDGATTLEIKNQLQVIPEDAVSEGSYQLLRISTTHGNAEPQEA